MSRERSLHPSTPPPHLLPHPPLPVSDKLAFPVISALGIVVCAVRQRSLGAADGTRAGLLGPDCVGIALPRHCHSRVLIASALICRFGGGGGGGWGVGVGVVASCQSCHQQNQSQYFHQPVRQRGDSLHIPVTSKVKSCVFLTSE